MTTSAKLQEIILDLLADMKSHSVQEMKNYLEQSGATEYSEGQFAGSINTLLRNKTIIKIDRAIYKLAKESRGADNVKYCFVVSPIGEEGSEIRANADKLLKHIINPVCQSCGLSVERVDQVNDSDSITQTIIDKLLSADLVIADISGHNPNVFYDDLSQEEHENILETKAKRADKDNFNNVIEILANINDVFYWYAEDEDLYFFGTNEKVFALKPKSIQAIQKAIEGFITPIAEQLKIIEPLYELLVRRFGNIKNFIEDLKEDSTLLGEFCKEMSVSLCMDVDDIEQRVLIYLQIYCEEKRMSVKVITTQGEELIINPEV